MPYLEALYKSRIKYERRREMMSTMQNDAPSSNKHSPCAAVLNASTLLCRLWLTCVLLRPSQTALIVMEHQAKQGDRLLHVHRANTSAIIGDASAWPGNENYYGSMRHITIGNTCYYQQSAYASEEN